VIGAWVGAGARARRPSTAEHSTGCAPLGAAPNSPRRRPPARRPQRPQGGTLTAPAQDGQPPATTPQVPASTRGLGTRRRISRQGGVVLAALQASDAFRSAQDLHTELRHQGQRIGLATVYRHLQVLTEQGEVDQTRTDDGEIVYRRCDTTSHHHHLVCRHCGRTVEVEGPEVERWTQAVAAEHGFTDVDHTLEILGTCTRCAS
jgi:Fur family ferric uptake transcriptional regulator